MSTTLSKDYKERIMPALVKEFGYTTVMQVPKLEKIVINQGLGDATQDKKLIETSINELCPHFRVKTSRTSRCERKCPSALW